MTLSPPKPREHLHTRRVECEGFAREDGLWDIDGRLTDQKTYGFENRWRGAIEAGTPVHDMRVRLTLDNKFIVQDIEVEMAAAPFQCCASPPADFRKLIGLSVGPGWNRRVAELVGGLQGCTHVTEVLGRMAMAAFQTIPMELYRRAKQAAEGNAENLRAMLTKGGRKPYFIDGCHTWRADGETVKEEFPEIYTGPKDTDQRS
ncbi:MAG: DUF2889 domain-containing protein [Sphingomonadales bacterium]